MCSTKQKGGNIFVKYASALAPYRSQNTRPKRKSPKAGSSRRRILVSGEGRLRETLMTQSSGLPHCNTDFDTVRCKLYAKKKARASGRPKGSWEPEEFHEETGSFCSTSLRMSMPVTHFRRALAGSPHRGIGCCGYPLERLPAYVATPAPR